LKGNKETITIIKINQHIKRNKEIMIMTQMIVSEREREKGRRT